MPIRRLPEDGAAAGIYTLLAAIDTMPPVLTRAESAFDRLVSSVTGALDVIGAALDSLERRHPTEPSPAEPVPVLQHATFTSADADLLALGEDRLNVEDLIAESMVEQVTASENIAFAQEDAARRSDTAWGALSDDIVGDFDRAFADISKNGTDTFSFIWRDMASGLGEAYPQSIGTVSLARMRADWHPQPPYSRHHQGRGWGGFSGLTNAGGSLLPAFCPVTEALEQMLAAPSYPALSAHSAASFHRAA